MLSDVLFKHWVKKLLVRPTYGPSKHIGGSNMTKVSAKWMSCRLGCIYAFQTEKNWTCGLNVGALDVLLKHWIYLLIYLFSLGSCLTVTMARVWSWWMTHRHHGEELNKSASGISVSYNSTQITSHPPLCVCFTGLCHNTPAVPFFSAGQLVQNH